MMSFFTRGLAAGLILTSAQEILPVAAKTDWQTWGPYRPGLYFGVRPQIPDSLLMGLMWAGGEDKDTFLKTLRDTCQQDDGMKGYGWTAYDPRVGGSQVIHDEELNIDIKTDFVKNEDGSGWAVRVFGSTKPGAEMSENTKTSLIFHIAHEAAIGSSKKALVCESLEGGNGHVSGAECRGKDPNLGSFEFRVNADPKTNRIGFKAIRSLKVPENKIWRAKDVFIDEMKSDDSKNNPGAGNMHFIEFDFKGSFSAMFSYRVEGALHISPDTIGEKLDEMGPSFSSQIDRVFLQKTPFRDEKYTPFTEGLLSNLLGGMGYFHGNSKIDLSHAQEYQETDLNFWVKEEEAIARAKITTWKPTSLLSFTPSRPFFPRGFLWDEGFHLLPVIEWDLDLAISVLRSWIELMNDDGWIAREQILGPEARSRVPDQFQVQYPHHANPPTLIALVLPALLSKLEKTSPYYGHPSIYMTSYVERIMMLRELYHALARNYLWFRHTQAGNFTAYPRPQGAVVGEGYRWRGRTPTHTLASGLDDYPRADPPHPGELHVDALAWVGASASALLQVARYIGENDDVDLYQMHLEDVKHNLDVLHWDETKGAYCDATIVSSGKKAQYERVCHLGYVSLSPLFLGLMNASHPNLPTVLNSLRDPAKLWSPHGLRSLSAADEFYGTEEDYWRGAVWMNVNSLAVLRLRELGLEDRQEGPTAIQKKAMLLAAELRDRVVNTVYKSYGLTGFTWEQYDDATGQGRHSRAFTGWTACVLLMMGLEFSLGKTGSGSGSDGVVGGKSSIEISTSPIMMLSIKTAFGSVIAILLFVVFRRKLLRLVTRVGDHSRSWGGDRRGRARYKMIRDMDMREA